MAKELNVYPPTGVLMEWSNVALEIGSTRGIGRNIATASPALPQDNSLTLGRADVVVVGSEKPNLDCAKARTAAARRNQVEGIRA